ncbi:FAD-dependent monooxygenase [Methylobacterium sp. J-088]|uniref:FAD-dependent monooxygenase n=1 Tax=Methylobacterium sp. J-088 TaxID=2836664 RepID=UPI001FB88E3E|nr:FAD-dependent monooxygenase [Methylobacterium sp. J-088]MCJ2061605.1 FAD-dependent monooxygenase [Methylobacterium sp. J-088]
MHRILITGGSIAGNAAAWWLGRSGFDVTVVERAPAFRDGGQNVDVRGVGREVLRRMGLEQAALDAGTGEEGLAWVDERGRTAAKVVAEPGTDGPTAEMEILRGDLARLIYEPASQRVAYRFDERITAIDDRGGDVAVTFAGGRTETFDAVVVAEGVGSATRELVFPGENDPRWMGMLCAYFTIPRADGDGRMWRWYNAPERRSVTTRPDRKGTTRATLTIVQPPGGEHDWDAGRQKAYLHERFADAGWQTPRVLAAMDGTKDFYFDALRQVRMPCWSKGRVVLVGDAAWCVTPLGGIGATLAIAGAYVLAGELALHDDPAAAFIAYERAMRPMVTQGQAVPSFLPRLAHPRTRLGIALAHGVLAILTRPVLSRLAARLFTSNPKEPDLSRYPRIGTA